MDIHSRAKALDEILELHSRFVSSGGKDGIKLDLSGRDLRYIDLSGANLANANLRRANLSQAHLEGANLHHANMTETLVRWSDLVNVDIESKDKFRSR